MGQSKTKLNIIVCGLDNSGKTTLINALKPKEHRSDTIAATVGYSVETFSLGKVKFTAFDMGGAKKFRSLWESYYSNVHGVVFVVDSSETLRMCVVKDEIQQMLEHGDLNGTKSKVPFLIFANKMDLPGARTAVEMTQILQLPEMMGSRPYNICMSNAVEGIGLKEGMEWLQKNMLQNTTTAAK